MNHRIAPQDSIRSLKEHYISILGPWAKSTNVSLRAFGSQITKPSASEVSLTLTSHYELEPSPVSDHEDSRFGWLADTLREVFGEKVIVAPTLLSGNTDTRYYWSLSSQIYRMSPWRAAHDPRGTRMHTVDERMPVKGLMEMVRFYHAFVCKVDNSRRSSSSSHR